jgi:hypothetical protein
VDSCNDQAREKCESIGNCHRWVPFPVFFSHHFFFYLYFRALENEEYCPKCSRILNERFILQMCEIILLVFDMDTFNDILYLRKSNHI